MFTTITNLIFNPDRVVCIHFSRDEGGSVTSARLLFDTGQEVRLSDKSAQEAVDALSSTKSSVGMTAATSEA